MSESNVMELPKLEKNPFNGWGRGEKGGNKSIVACVSINPVILFLAIDETPPTYSVP